MKELVNILTLITKSMVCRTITKELVGLVLNSYYFQSFKLVNFKHVGDLGNINSDEKQRATFRIVDQKVKLWDIIGRTICISEKPDFKHNDTGQK